MLYEGCLVQISRFLEFLGCQIAFVPPRLSETSDEWFFEELIDGKLEFLAEFTGRLADVPFVDIHCCHSPHFGEAHRIEGARDGFLPMKTSATIGGIDGAEGTSSFVLDKNTVLATNDLSDQFPIFVRIDDPFCLNLLLGIRREVVMNHLISFLKQPYFFHCDGSTGITFNAAGTMTLLQVTTEEYFEEVE